MTFPVRYRRGLLLFVAFMLLLKVKATNDLNHTFAEDPTPLWNALGIVALLIFLAFQGVGEEKKPA